MDQIIGIFNFGCGQFVNGSWEKFVLARNKPQKAGYSIILCGKGKSVVYLEGLKWIVTSSL